MAELKLSNDLAPSTMRIRIDVHQMPRHGVIFEIADAIIDDVNRPGVLPEGAVAELDYLGRGSLIVQLLINHWETTLSLIGTAASLAGLWKGGSGSAPPVLQQTFNNYGGTNIYIMVAGADDATEVTKAALDKALPNTTVKMPPPAPPALPASNSTIQAWHGTLTPPKVLGHFLVHNDEWAFVMAGGTPVAIESFGDRHRPFDDVPVLANLTAVKLPDGTFSRDRFTVSAWGTLSLPPARRNQPVVAFEGKFETDAEGNAIFNAGPAGKLLIKNIGNMQPSDTRYALIGWRYPFGGLGELPIVEAYNVYKLDE